MIISQEQSDKWNKEAIDYLKENEYEWIFANFDENTGAVSIIKVEDHDRFIFEDVEEYVQMLGSELLEYKGHVQYCLFDLSV